jgi:hypothetical protein
MQIHLPGTASSYPRSAGSVCLNFLQMRQGGLTDIAKFTTNIFNTILSIAVIFIVQRKFKLIFLYTTNLHLKLATQNYFTNWSSENNQYQKLGITLWSGRQNGETENSVHNFLSQCNIRNLPSLAEKIMYIWIWKHSNGVHKQNTFHKAVHCLNSWTLCVTS